MNTVEIIGTALGAVIVMIVLWKILRHGTLPPRNDVDPDDYRSAGA